MAVVYGTDGDDDLGGTNGDDVIAGFGGSDTLEGGDGDDYLYGGDGYDRLQGFLGSDMLIGGAGPDDFFVGRTFHGNDVIFDFDNLDRIVLNHLVSTADIQRLHVTIARQDGASIIRSTADGFDSGGTLFVYGAVVQGHDFHTWDPTTFAMYGDGAADTLDAGSGADVLVGAGGDDRLVGRGGADILYGGEGADAFYVISANDSTMAAYDVVMDFETGVDTLNVIGLTQSSYDNFAISRLDGSTFVYFGREGQAFAGVVVSLTDVNGIDLISGGAKPLDLAIYGATGADELIGGLGNDTMLGGDGDDVIEGGAGGDSLFGGAGVDVFVVGSSSESSVTLWDVIQDFQTGVDRLDLRGAADDVLLSSFGGATFVYFNPNASGGYDGLVLVQGVIAESDILLGAAPAASQDWLT